MVSPPTGVKSWFLHYCTKSRLCDFIDLRDMPVPSIEDAHRGRICVCSKKSIFHFGIAILLVCVYNLEW